MRILTKLLVPSVLFFATATAEEKTHDIQLQIQINCPESEQFAEFLKTIPEPGHHAQSFEEWKAMFLANMNSLVALVESEAVNNCAWGVNAQEHKDQAEAQVEE